MTTTTTEPREITAEEYDRMLNVLPPVSMPRIKETEAFWNGFTCPSEYDITEDGKPTYPTYGIKGGKFYFIGYLPRN